MLANSRSIRLELIQEDELFPDDFPRAGAEFNYKLLTPLGALLIRIA